MRKDSAHDHRCHVPPRLPTAHHDPPPAGPTSAPRATCPVASAAPPRALGPFYACGECFGPLEVAYEFGAVTRASIEAGPQNIWRYQDLLPVPSTVRDTPNLEPGCTPLVRADNLARELGMRALWVKDDSGNPTHSFKDRVVAVALAAARELGFTTLACPSTGNLANAVAAAAARAGHPLGRADPGRPRAAEDRHDRGVRRRRWSPSRAPTTTSTGSPPSWPASTRTGRSSTSTSGPTTPRAPRRSGYEVAERLGWRLPRAGRHPGRVRLAADQGRQGVPRAGHARPGRGDAVQDLRRAGHRLLAGVARRSRPATTSSARCGRRHDRQVARHRQPGRRAVRAGHRPAHRRRGRGRHRRGGRRGHPAAGAHRGHLRRDRRRRDRRDAAASCSPPGSSTRTPRPSCSTPATA